MKRTKIYVQLKKWNNVTSFFELQIMKYTFVEKNWNPKTFPCLRQESHSISKEKCSWQLVEVYIVIKFRLEL